MQRFFQMYRVYFSDRDFRIAFFFSLTLFISSMGVCTYAITYATERASNFVTDIVLSNLPVFNVDAIFVYGTFVIIVFVGVLLAVRLQWVPFVLATLGVFYFIRAAFVSLTHIGPFPDRIAQDWGVIINTVVGGHDLFFSGHTGAPFLLALIFWKEPALRFLFLAWSVIFGIVVLLGHVHYSIDVLSAYFITYTIFHLGEFFFAKYRVLFYNGLDNKQAM